ncbi:hypothetical protein CEP45_04715 [Mergibacter septicus]|uniref:D-2-hydroxyglutarate dehydrogenase YdiJ n=1 Tax=Mergibacter septicus TaxID=221402 RepID=UPI001C74C5B2|nr:FAD-binding and (Fe-S)-binding domain-containing protein [Mergibacter septicus]QDJ13192.1 hypothetical protein CEP45_04715 [Mergibacter septicus]
MIIPRLDQHSECRLDFIVQDYLMALKEQQFAGDIAASYAERLSLATDNSVYQQLPQAILFPKDIADLVRITRLAQREKFRALQFTPRGGGTGTNGQSLNKTLIIDLSRYFTQILELNIKERWVRVQAGVVKDQLNQFLKPYGLFFAPELSTSNRATIGGMINTDASGQGSRQYGKTSDHVLGLRSVLINGEILDTESIDVAQLDSSHLSPTVRYLSQAVSNICQQNSELIAQLPQLNRFITGYDLKHVFNADKSKFNLSRILTGSEGSLALIAEAKLNLLPIPECRMLINIKYNSFDAALRNAPFMLAAKALSVETIDSTVLELAKQDIIWHSVSELLTETDDNPILGLNIVEYAGEARKVKQQVNSLCQQLEQKMAKQQEGIIGYQVCCDLDSLERIYTMRKKAVGLLGNTKGNAKPIPFVEDTCVPPEYLADYITEFRALLDQHQLQYGMFGHVDAGVLHVRPALDLCDVEQVKLFKALSDQVTALTQKYGGLLWGEHGKGMRSGYAEQFFGEKLWLALRQIKGVFDPENRLNPGKICTPLQTTQTKIEPLYSILSPMRADYDRQIPISIRQVFKGAMNCNGNGLCFNFDVHNTMCPSMKVSGNRLFSPKGRAALIREWLRLLAQQGITPEQLDFRSDEIKLTHLLKKFYYSFNQKRTYDFSHEVKAAMDSCLACKACAGQCPIKIDVPKFRAEFLALYHRRYLRPIKDYVIANIEYVAPLMAKAPRFFNFFSTNRWSEKLAYHTLGLVDLPQLSSPSLQQQLVEIGYQGLTLEQVEQMLLVKRQKLIFVVQDPFTSFYEAKVVADFVCLVKKLGFQPIVLPFKPNGKAQHIKGFLSRFAKTASQQAEMLNRVARTGVPMVGIEPAIVLSYRDEYQQILADKRGNFKVLTAQEWLIDVVQQPQVKDRVTELINSRLPENLGTTPTNWYLFSHCTESTLLPNSAQLWQQIFTLFGQNLQIEKVGCCGMAGTFGHERDKVEMSKQIYQLSWAEKLKDKTLSACLATGYSCRSQVKRMEKQLLKHPVQALLEVMKL